MSSEQEKLLELLKAEDDYRKYNKLKLLFPDTGKYRRELYPKHISFLDAGLTNRERAFIAGNRTGKTLTSCFELAAHLSGIYPSWWKGKRFNRPVKCWSCGTTTKTVRDILQAELLGPRNDHGSGLIPRDSILRTTTKPGVPDGIETIEVKHISGGTSVLTFKSYDSGVDSFVGTAMDVIQLDEEPPQDIYTECLIRTATTNGVVLCTFTPIHGISEVVKSFLPGGRLQEEHTKFVVMVGWDEVPHLDEATKKSLLDGIPLYQREARTKGIPQLGRGAIYPVAESDIVCKPFEIPEHWPKAFGMDVGWNRTAAVWGAWDRENDVLYLYSEHYRGQAEPSVHADGILARGDWINGAIDPASRGRSQIDGTQLLQVYCELGLNLFPADNSREAGIHKVYQRLSSGRLKIFSTLQNTLGEMRLYRRDDNGKVVKEDDHLMDCIRYLVMSGLDLAITEPYNDYQTTSYADTSSGRSTVSGY